MKKEKLQKINEEDKKQKLKNKDDETKKVKNEENAIEIQNGDKEKKTDVIKKK